MKFILTIVVLVVATIGIGGCAVFPEAGSDDGNYGESDMHEMIRKTGGERALETF